jgi:hypothetical protein
MHFSSIQPFRLFFALFIKNKSKREIQIQIHDLIQNQICWILTRLNFYLLFQSHTSSSTRHHLAFKISQKDQKSQIYRIEVLCALMVVKMARRGTTFGPATAKEYICFLWF